MSRAKKLHLSEEHLHILLHSLGIQNRGGKWSKGGWRNYFSTNTGDDSLVECKLLAVGGWMVGFSVPSAHGEEWTFRVTEAGVAALKLSGWKIEVEP